MLNYVTLLSVSMDRVINNLNRAGIEYQHGAGETVSFTVFGEHWIAENDLGTSQYVGLYNVSPDEWDDASDHAECVVPQIYCLLQK